MENRITSMEKPKLNISDDFPSQTFEEWKTKVIADLKEKPFEKLKTTTYEGIILEPLYDFEHNEKLLEEIPYPSRKNYRRGFDASGYSLRDWQIAQSIFEPNPNVFNEVAHDELNQRQNSISTAVNGINNKLISDKLSLSINNYNDFRTAFQRIDFTKIPVHVLLSFDYLRFYEYLKNFAEENYLSNENFKGSFAADPIRTFVASGRVPQLNMNEDSLKFTEFVTKMANRFPPVKTIGIDVSIYSDAGGSAIHELAFALATGVEYFNILNEKLPINTLARKTKFTFGLGSNFFMEIAKLRAFRILWNSVLEAFNVTTKPQRILVESKSSQFVHTITEPYSNLLRITTEALSGVIGGADLIQVFPHNVGFEKPDDFARRIATNVQIIIREETSVREVIDSAGGSYFVENLTNQLVDKAWEMFQDIEKNGGMLQSLRKGLPQTLVTETREKKISDLKKRKFSLIGTNVYVKSSDAIPDEISSELENRSSFLGSWTKITPFDFTRASKIFEDLLKSVNEYSRNSGDYPQVEGITFGKISDYKPRADFSRSLFETGAFNLNFHHADNFVVEAKKLIEDASSEMILFVSSDKNYLESIEDIKFLISANASKTFIIAGKNSDVESSLINLPNVEFIYAGMNVYDFLKNIFENKILSK